ncbi:MAG: hypothetical protein IKW83_00595 [Muribaculaceae bacterium]|nr:hypothetical protein [Muribaculaceae bacterium]
MSSWIYLNSTSNIDALALSAVLNASDKCFNVVKQSRFNFVLEGHPKIEQYGHPSKDDDVICISTDNSSFSELCDKIATQLAIDATEFTPFIPVRSKMTSSIGEIIGNSKILIILEKPNDDEAIDVFLIDAIVQGLNAKGYEAIQTGFEALPHIRKSYDLRGFDSLQILHNFDSVSQIITNSSFWQILSKYLNKSCYVVSDVPNPTMEMSGIAKSNTVINQISNSIQHGK